MRRFSTLLTRAVAALCVGYFALWACAPMTVGPSPVPLAEEAPNAFGGDVGVSVMNGGYFLAEGAGPHIGLWYARELGPRWSGWMRLSSGKHSVLSGGGGLRVDLTAPSSRVLAGLDLEAGGVYARIGVPLRVP